MLLMTPCFFFFYSWCMIVSTVEAFFTGVSTAEEVVESDDAIMITSETIEHVCPIEVRGIPMGFDFMAYQQFRLKQWGKLDNSLFETYNVKTTGILNCIVGPDNCVSWSREQANEEYTLVTPIEERYAPSYREAHASLYAEPIVPNENSTNVITAFTNPYEVQPNVEFQITLTPKFFREQVLRPLLEKGYMEHEKSCYSSGRKKNLLVLEVGSSEGASTRMMARVLDNLFRGVDVDDFSRKWGEVYDGEPVILAVDPWHRPLTWGAMFAHDYSTDARSLYYDLFMTNINSDIDRQQYSADIVLPIQATNDEAMNFISLLTRWRPDVIYLDASHTEGETWRELHTFFSLLPRGGILFGDDYDWSGVRNAADRFVKVYGHLNCFDFWVESEIWPDSNRFILRKKKHLHLEVEEDDPRNDNKTTTVQNEPGNENSCQLCGGESAK